MPWWAAGRGARKTGRRRPIGHGLCRCMVLMGCWVDLLDSVGWELLVAAAIVGAAGPVSLWTVCCAMRASPEPTGCWLRCVRRLLHRGRHGKPLSCGEIEWVLSSSSRGVGVGRNAIEGVGVA